MQQGREKKGRIGHAPSDDHVGASSQSGDDPLGPQVGVCGNEAVPHRTRGLPDFGEGIVPVAHEVENVVSGHGGNFQPGDAE